MRRCKDASRRASFSAITGCCRSRRRSARCARACRTSARRRRAKARRSACTGRTTRFVFLRRRRMADSSPSPLPVPAQAAPRTGETRATAAPWLLAAPALLLFCGLLLVPLLLTAVLSFHAFDGTQGVLPTFTLANYAEVLSD